VPRLVARLRESDCDINVWVPELQAVKSPDLVPDADLYLWKSHGRLCDGVAAYLHARGSNLLNEYFATVQVRDKLITTGRLVDAGLPTPEAFYADDLDQLALIVDSYPVVVKPSGGRRGAQVALARDPDGLLALRGMDGPVCAQRYVEGSGMDLKVYVIGERVFTVRRPSPLVPSAGDDRQLARLAREIECVSLRCGEVFGLELYGVDLLETPDGPFVIEVNCFPGYKGVPEADRLLAEYIVHRALG
jgi:ribosomal protein S6--L-glutamate ligase